MRRIVKIAVRFSHTKTALCDRKDTQSHFVVNAARSIVCVGTRWKKWYQQEAEAFQCRTQHCVCRDITSPSGKRATLGFQCRTQHCVCRDEEIIQSTVTKATFQCRTQHCVCRDNKNIPTLYLLCTFQCRTQHCVCRDDVSRSPCPVRAEKAFWKDETAVCGFAPVPEHSPFPSPL